MESPDERVTPEEPTEGRAQTHSERGRAQQEEVSDRLRHDARVNEQRRRDVARQVSATESSIAATLHEMAERARQEGRMGDAKRLADEAAAAVEGAERERRQAEWRPSVHHDPRETAPQRRDEAAQGRDEVARERDDAARQRDVVASRRDEQTVDRGVAAGLRDAAAEKRSEEETEWARRLAASAGGAPSNAGAEQVAIDTEVGETYRRFAEDNRRRASADRARDASDRAEAGRNRMAAGEDRAAARTDREAARRDRAAAAADREQEVIDRETRRERP